MQKRAYKLSAHHLLLLFVVSMCFANCSQNADERLTKVEQLTSTAPDVALDSLNKIDYNQLSDADKQYHDFLMIKTKDKAFIHHSSDSLILKVIENEGKHKGRGRYPEAMYYGGRVYHDLGDMPTALHYYQNALDLIDDNSSEFSLKGKILSQLAGVLNSLRLYDEAIPYIKEVMTLDSINRDSINYMMDIVLLGSINLHKNNFDSAESNFVKAKSIATKLALKDTIRHNIYLAAIKYKKNRMDSALSLIQPTILGSDSIYRNLALAYACYIYRKADLPDTAIMYAKQLINSSDLLNRHTEYQIIFSEEIPTNIPVDSLIQYISDYNRIIENQLESNGNQAAFIQNSMYNYQLHERERVKNELQKKRLSIWLLGSTICILGLVIYLLYIKVKNKSLRLQLHDVIDNVIILHQILNHKNSEEQKQRDIEKIILGVKPADKSNSDDVEKLRLKLREELLSICQSAPETYSTPSSILNSDVYGKIKQRINESKPISEESPIWKELEDTVLIDSPNFVTRLKLLCSGNYKYTDLHFALLLKCGLSSKDISILIGRGRSTVVYRKKILSSKIFEEVKEKGIIERIIRLL